MSKIGSTTQVLQGNEHKSKKVKLGPSFCIFNPRLRQLRRLRRIRRLINSAKRRARRRRIATRYQYQLPLESEALELPVRKQPASLRSSDDSLRPKKNLLPLPYCNRWPERMDIPKKGGLNENMSSTSVSAVKVRQRIQQVLRKRFPCKFCNKKLSVAELSKLVKDVLEFQKMSPGSVEPLCEVKGKPEVENQNQIYERQTQELTKGKSCLSITNVGKSISPIPIEADIWSTDESNTDQNSSRHSVLSTECPNNRNVDSRYADQAYKACESTDDETCNKPSRSSTNAQFIQELLCVIRTDSIPSKLIKRGTTNPSKGRSSILQQDPTVKLKLAKNGMGFVVEDDGVPQYVLIKQIHLKGTANDFSAVSNLNLEVDNEHNRDGIHKQMTYKSHDKQSPLKSSRILHEDTKPNKLDDAIYVAVKKPALDTCHMLDNRKMKCKNSLSSEKLNLKTSTKNSKRRQQMNCLDDDWNYTSTSDIDSASENEEEQNVRTRKTCIKPRKYWRHSDALSRLSESSCSFLQETKHSLIEAKPGYRNVASQSSIRMKDVSDLLRTKLLKHTKAKHVKLSKGTQTCKCLKCNTIEECDRYIGSIRTSRTTTSSSKSFCYCPGIGTECNMCSTECKAHAEDCDFCSNDVAYSSTNHEIVSASQEMPWKRTLCQQTACEYQIVPHIINKTEPDQSNGVIMKIHLPYIEITGTSAPYHPQRTVENITVKHLLDNKEMEVVTEIQPSSVSDTCDITKRDGEDTSTSVISEFTVDHQPPINLTVEEADVKVSEKEDGDNSGLKSENDLAQPYTQLKTRMNMLQQSEKMLKPETSSKSLPNANTKTYPIALHRKLLKSKLLKHKSRLPVVQFSNYSHSNYKSRTLMTSANSSFRKFECCDEVGVQTPAIVTPVASLSTEATSVSSFDTGVNSVSSFDAGVNSVASVSTSDNNSDEIRSGGVSEDQDSTNTGVTCNETDDFFPKLMKSLWRFVPFSSNSDLSQKSVDRTPREDLMPQLPETANAACSNTNLLLPNNWVALSSETCTSSTQIGTTRLKQNAKLSNKRLMRLRTSTINTRIQYDALKQKKVCETMKPKS